ncbi:TetR/AcrR family transcriptional regulator [Paraeggerthella sp.]|uniref:TetR/AcrR family transcriptional regulator n=1 Tax=Paraeggerthella sp. TaxID=2897350 RepID=UPI003526CB29
MCENAGISRQTFYRHFQSKYDIPWWHSIFCRQFYLNEIGRTVDWKTGVLPPSTLDRSGARFLPQVDPVQHQHAFRPDGHAREPQDGSAGNA